jgi:hypothetical protein
MVSTLRYWLVDCSCRTPRDGEHCVVSSFPLASSQSDPTRSPLPCPAAPDNRHGGISESISRVSLTSVQFVIPKRAGASTLHSVTLAPASATRGRRGSRCPVPLASTSGDPLVSGSADSGARQRCRRSRPQTRPEPPRGGGPQDTEGRKRMSSVAEPRRRGHRLGRVSHRSR